MNNTLICLIAQSGSGKTTIANELEKRYGLKQIYSYTTRPPRYENEIGHIFITEDDVVKYQNEIVAYTHIYSTHYFATASQVDECDIYVVDYAGYASLWEKYKGNKHIASVYLDVDKETRMKRMFDRGDSMSSALERLKNDDKIFKEVKDKCDYVIVNDDIDKTISEIIKIISE